MAWMTSLYETYENLEKTPELLKACKMPLVPVSHTVLKVCVEVTLNDIGDFMWAEYVPTESELTIAPCTEDSQSRSNTIAPHMLFDKLKYIAGDAAEYTGDEKTRRNYEAYCEQLRGWCKDDGCPDSVKAIYTYVSKGRLIHDLTDQGLLQAENGKLKWKGNKDSKPAGDLLSTFIRFNVRTQSGDDMDMEPIIKAYIEYDRKNYDSKGVCFVTGKTSRLTYKHPAAIRQTGDSAKLISAHDPSGFKFRGRFLRAEDAVAVGYEVSQKAHSALRWLIANQGFRAGDQTVLVWAVNNEEIPGVMEDSFGWGTDNYKADAYTPLDVYAKNIEKALNGYLHKDLDKPFETNKIIVMITEAATPGRLSIEYYKEFTDIDYIENIKLWHKSCVWNHNYKTIKAETDQETGEKKKETKHIRYTGAPSVNDMITSVYGAGVDEKLRKRQIKQLVSCIADRRRLPRDMIMSGVARISNPAGMDKDDVKKSTSVICAMIRKYYFDKGVEYDMAVDKENKDRSYLFGRVLAYAEEIEEYANYLSKEKRIPNARRLRNKFRQQPAKTWVKIDEKLEPYVEKLYLNNNKIYEDMQRIIDKINESDFMDNRSLSPLYLLGYASQKTEFMDAIEEAKKAKEAKQANSEQNSTKE